MKEAASVITWRYKDGSLRRAISFQCLLLTRLEFPTLISFLQVYIISNNYLSSSSSLSSSSQRLWSTGLMISWQSRSPPKTPPSIRR